VSTWITIFATVVTAATTVVLVILNARYVRLTARLVEESEAARKEAVRPYLSLTLTLLEEDNSFISLVIENSGMSAAYRTQFDVKQTYKSPNVTDLASIGLFKRGVNYFAPRQRYECFLAGGADEDFQQLMSNPIEIDATYTDVQNNKYREAYVLDFGVFENMSRIGEPSIVKIASAVDKAADALGSIASARRRVEVVTFTPEQAMRDRRMPIMSLKLRRLSAAAFKRIGTLIDKELDANQNVGNGSS